MHDRGSGTEGNQEQYAKENSIHAYLMTSHKVKTPEESKSAAQESATKKPFRLKLTGGSAYWTFLWK